MLLALTATPRVGGPIGSPAGSTFLQRIVDFLMASGEMANTLYREKIYDESSKPVSFPASRTARSDRREGDCPPVDIRSFHLGVDAAWKGEGRNAILNS